MSFDDTSPLPPDQHQPVRTQSDLRRLWRALIGDRPAADRRLWLLFLDPDDRPVGPLVVVDDLPDGPYDVPVDDLVDVCRDILDGPGVGGSVAMLVSRPGRGPWHVADRAWGRFLTAASHRIGGRVWPAHQANDVELSVVLHDPMAA